jgi:tRNA nucleotidyltransferase (CCA-adding enzyme)
LKVLFPKARKFGVSVHATATNCGWQIVHFTYEDVITIIFITTESSRLKQRVGPKQISATCRNFVIGKMIQGAIRGIK